MKCYICGCFDEVLYRQNDKGVKGIFACLKHNKIQISDDLLEVTSDLSSVMKNIEKGVMP